MKTHMLLALAPLLLLATLYGCGDPIDEAYSKGLAAYENANYVEAEKWYRQAANGGRVDGMCMLGVLYLYGRGVPRDGKTAESWLVKAAEAGYVHAQSIVGMMYATGAGVPTNPQKAQKWLSAAAAKEDKHAIRMLDLLPTQ